MCTVKICKGENCIEFDVSVGEVPELVSSWLIDDEVTEILIEVYSNG